jgi:hypothetical protein
VAGVSPPALLEVIMMPAVGETSFTVSWQGMDGHWSPLDMIMP